MRYLRSCAEWLYVVPEAWVMEARMPKIPRVKDSGEVVVCTSYPVPDGLLYDPNRTLYIRRILKDASRQNVHSMTVLACEDPSYKGEKTGT